MPQESRSLANVTFTEKGPFIDNHLMVKIEGMNRSTTRRCSHLVAPVHDPSGLVGHTIAVHNGNKFMPVY